MKPFRIFLVDDSPEFLRSAQHFLACDQDIQIVGYAPSGLAAVDQVAQLQPDVVLIDMMMPQMNGLEATRRIKQQTESPYVIVLTQDDTDDYRAAAMAAGADGLVAKAEFGVQVLPLIFALLDTHKSPTGGMYVQAPPSMRPADESL